jgi:hypothetical protein
MTNATINFGDLEERALRAQRSLAQAGQDLLQTPLNFASGSNRTFSVTDGALDPAGTAERFVSGVASGQVAPAIRDASSLISASTGFNPAASGAIAGGLDAILNGGGIQGALQGAVTGALNNVIATSGIGDALNNAAAQFGAQLPAVPGLPALGGIPGISPSGASGGAAAAARSGVTRSGTLATDSPAPARTSIQDASTQDVTITVDSFLQGLQGSLSSLPEGIGGLVNNMLNQLLSSTGLTGALGGLVSGLSEGLSNALGGLTNALGQAASGLMQGLGNAIQSIPGVGPVLSGMTNAIGDFAGNLSNAYGNLSPGLKAGVDGAIAAVGANVVNRLDIPGVPRISPAIAGAATAAISFSNNPVTQLNDIANAARNLDKRTFKETRDPTFSNLASAASRAAQEMQQNLQRTEDGNYQLIKDPDDAQANVTKTGVITNGELQPTSNTFVDNLNDIQLQSYQTYERILRNKFIYYEAPAPDLAVQAYNEYIEFNSLKTPETKNLINVIEIKDANLIKQLADRFLTFYRSSKSRYTLTNV